MTPPSTDLPQDSSFEIPIDSITVGERIRRDFGDISEFAEQIKNEGLIQPIVVTRDHRLIAGERRLRAHKHLGLTTIKAVYFEVMDDAELTRLEASENIHRKDFSWQERVLAIDKVHRLKSTEAALKSEDWGVRETGRLINRGKSSVALATEIATYLHANDEEIWSADSMLDAFRILVKRREDEVNKALVKSTMPKSASPGRQVKLPVEIADSEFFSHLEAVGLAPLSFVPGISSPDMICERPGETKEQPTVIPLSQMLLKQDGYNALTTMEALGPDCCDHIITDPPYAIDMDMLQQDQGGIDISSVKEEHDVGKNVDLLDLFIATAYNAVRDRGFVIFWTDITMWERATCKANSVGFTVQRWPLTWHKTHTCSNQASQYNFTKNTEIAIVLRKGNATLIKQQPSSVWTGSNDVEARALGHPFAKPFGLWDWQYDAVCLRGATILDPFAGRGSSTIPAIRRGLRPITIESNEAHYNALVVNVQNFYRSLNPNVTFA